LGNLLSQIASEFCGGGARFEHGAWFGCPKTPRVRNGGGAFSGPSSAVPGSAAFLPAPPSAQPSGLRLPPEGYETLNTNNFAQRDGLKEGFLKKLKLFYVFAKQDTGQRLI
jgi:hypothetical protein